MFDRDSPDPTATTLPYPRAGYCGNVPHRSRQTRGIGLPYRHYTGVSGRVLLSLETTLLGKPNPQPIVDAMHHATPGFAATCGLLIAM